MFPLIVTGDQILKDRFTWFQFRPPCDKDEDSDLLNRSGKEMGQSKEGLTHI